ncbi:hypothetical protein [Streptomyces sp. NPDC007205]|uniref:hypothetical protein n=1 Tax=Streptomyces sp. NPDC007205 TaxID=3154316 RepID=UPI0033BFF3FD
MSARTGRHSAGIRVQSLTPDRKLTSYSWHKVCTGAATEKTWPASLQDNRGIWALGCDESSWDGDRNH